MSNGNRHYMEEWGPADNRGYSCACGNPWPCPDATELPPYKAEEPVRCTPADLVPIFVFGPTAVYNALPEKAKQRTSLENITDALEAISSIIDNSEASGPAQATQGSELAVLQGIITDLHDISVRSMKQRPAQAIGCACVYDHTKRSLAILDKLKVNESGPTTPEHLTLLQKLFATCDSELPRELWATDYPHLSEAETLLKSLNLLDRR